MTTQNQNPNPPINSPSFSAGGSTNAQACAACKYQRRRCAPDCVLAPFFPASRPKDFNNARRLFGVKSISKVAKSMTPPDREKAVKSMIYEANIRAVDPVGGCYRIVIDLKNQIAQCESELHYCKALIGYFRGQNDFRNPNFENGGRGDLNVGMQPIEIMNLDGEAFGVKNTVVNGASSSGLKKVDNGGCSSGSGLSFGGVGDVDVKPLVKQLESSKVKQWRESVGPKKDDVEAIQPPKQLQKQGENCLINGNS